MIDRVRILIRLARPSALVIFALFAMTGLAQAGAGDASGLRLHVLVVVVSFVLFSVVLNDLADRAIDEINLGGDRGRPLVVGSASNREFLTVGVTAGCVALIAAAFLSWLALVVVAAGLVFSACYSLRPVRVADRGAVASLLLPMGYVAVPYLVGIVSVRGAVTYEDMILGAALYVGFIGRILLKDFRDVRGDSLFGKRTFLVRHGRRWTCAFSAACWLAGTAALTAIRGCTPSLVVSYAAHVALALGLLHALAADGGPRRDERLISAMAIVGRSVVVTVIAHLSMANAGWSAVRMGSMVLALTVLTVSQAWTMVRLGPVRRRRCDIEELAADVKAVMVGVQ